MRPKKIFWLIFLLCLCLGAGGYFALDKGKKEQLVKRVSDGFHRAITSEKIPSSEFTSEQSGHESPTLSLPEPSNPLPLPSISQEESLNNYSNVGAQKKQPLGPLQGTNGRESNSTLLKNREDIALGTNSTAANGVDAMAPEETSKNSANATAANGREDISAKASQPSDSSSHDASEQVITFTIADQKRPGNALRGKILPIDPNHGLMQVKQDSVIPYSFLQDLATFLTENYWPTGTHPSAINHSYSSVTLRWINNRYGSFFSSGEQNSRPDEQREKVLSYAFNPLVMQALEKLYANRFIEALKESGFSRFSGEKESNTYVADMITYYSLKAKGVAAALKGFISAKEARERSLLYIDAEGKLQEAFHQYDEARFSSQHGDSSVLRIAANNYQTAIRVRDQAKIRVASVMRRSTDTRRLTEDELSFIALWMTRRNQETYPGIIAFADALERVSKRMNIEANLLRK